MNTEIFAQENTMEAFQACLKLPVNGIELDVHLSSDGHVVVIRDADSLSTENELVSSFTTLSEVYTLLSGTKLTVNVELKTLDYPCPDLVEKLINLEQQHNMDGRVIYTSLNHYSLQELKQQHPSAKIGLIYNMGMVDPWEYAKKMGAYSINPHFSVIKSNPSIVKSAQENGIKVHTWTVNEPADIEQMGKCGVDAIITDKPKVAFFLLDE